MTHRPGPTVARVAGLALGATLLAVTMSISHADVVVIAPAKDNTLIEDPNGLLSNGAGPFLFAGRTNQATGSIRRGLVAFDVAAQIPAGSTIQSARLTMHLVALGGAPSEVAIHRALATWGEGTSSGTGGKGAPATTGDATWLHRFYDATFWTSPGGEFSATPSASQLRDVPGTFEWASTPEMVSDVQGWLDSPATNAGWVLVGDESAAQTVLQLASRESVDPNLPGPALEIEYDPPCVNPRFTGPGYWNRQCLGVPVDQGGLKPGKGKGKGPKAPTEPNFNPQVMTCTADLLADLGIAATSCEGIDPQPKNDKCEKALRKLTTIAFNVCTGRLATSCPVKVGAKGCSASDVGDLLEELALLIGAGDCQKAMRCAGGFE